MAIHNSDIAEAFDKVADLLEIKGENPFRVRAYRNAARTIRELSNSVADLVSQDKDLTEIPGIGKDLAGKIKEMVMTGKLSILEEIKKNIPQGLSSLMKIQGMGPKRVSQIFKTLGISSVEDLKKAAESKKIRMLPGFGSKTEERILEEIDRMTAETRRYKLVLAEQIAEPLLM